MENKRKELMVKEALKVQEYLKMGLKQSEVARVMKTTRQQVNRWVQYVKKGLVTVKSE